MDKGNKEEFKLTTITHCTLIYFVSLCTVILIQSNQASSHGTSGLGSLLAIIILKIILFCFIWVLLLLLFLEDGYLLLTC